MRAHQIESACAWANKEEIVHEGDTNSRVEVRVESFLPAVRLAVHPHSLRLVDACFLRKELRPTRVTRADRDGPLQFSVNVNVREGQATNEEWHAR